MKDNACEGVFDDLEEMHEECGVFGVYDRDGGDVAGTILWIICTTASWTGKLWYCSK